MSERTTTKYPSEHADLHMSMYFDDPTFKGRMSRLAELDGRRLSDWFRHFVINKYVKPFVEQEEIRLGLPPYIHMPQEIRRGPKPLGPVSITKLYPKKLAKQDRRSR